MGTINYRTSDYITMGLNPCQGYDLENDPNFIEELKEYARDNNIDFDSMDITEECQDYAHMVNEDDYYNIKSILDKYSFYYYHITINSGYYEGFYLDIENNYGICYDSYEDKKDVQKEITQIKTMLTEMAGCGLVQVYPGWCTGYEDYKGTIKGIKAAIKEMREEVRAIPTWTTYERQTA